MKVPNGLAATAFVIGLVFVGRRQEQTPQPELNGRRTRRRQTSTEPSRRLSLLQDLLIREVFVALLVAGLAGAILFSLESEREDRRLERELRANLAAQLAVKDDLSGIVLAGQEMQGLVLVGRNLTEANLKKQKAGLEYGPGVTGKRSYRVSEQYLADHVAPLITQRRADAVKLDLVLRGVALSPEYTGEHRTPGTVLRKQSRLDYVGLHDLVRDPRRFATSAPEYHADNAAERDKKREWAREQLIVLEQRKLLTREPLHDGRQEILMYCDTGDGSPFDDPGDKSDPRSRSYITILGKVIVDDRFRTWGATELVGYFCAMIADSHQHQSDKKDHGKTAPHGASTWNRQPAWFNNKNGWRPEWHVIPSFSTKTIERGLAAMRDLGYVDAYSSSSRPGGGRLLRSRRIYTNRFDAVGSTSATVIPLDSRRSA